MVGGQKYVTSLFFFLYPFFIILDLMELWVQVERGILRP